MVMEINTSKTLHFIGIGGSGMSPLAKICLKQGYKVTGSDLKESLNTITLKEAGAKIFYGHKSSNLREADIVVVSTAIQKDNPEYIAASQAKTILRRAEMLDIIMRDHKKKIAVAGTHGKSTTTAMVARILETCKKNSTYVIGAELQDYGGNAAYGTGPYFLTEADESDGSFLCLHPNVGLLTNIESEHMDYYKNFKDLLDHFTKFIQKILDVNGYLIINQDDKHLVNLTSKIPKENLFSYSIENPSQVMAKNISFSSEGSSFQLFIDEKNQGEIHLKVFGRHNIYNALAAISLGLQENLPLDLVKKALFNFSGTNRRFQQIAQINNIVLYDDYAHHPTEIKVTLDAIKQSFPEKRIVCIFQPHRYTRTLDQLDNFPHAFNSSDITIITEIYAASEKKIAGISGKLIADKIEKEKKLKSKFIEKKSDIANYLIPLLKENDLVITMGAGNINYIAKELIARLKSKATAP
ncbi:UDP-N-acetylmuramate--L-alanine ligase [Candidatus Margulisiibacteriota bacterium]